MSLSRRDFSCSLAAGGLLSGCASLPADEPSLDALARAKGLRFGSTLGSLGHPSRFHDLAYRELTGRECSVLVCENETKWQQLRPDPRQPYQFAAADEMFAWGRSRGMTLRGHTLLWMPSKWLPRWVNEHDFGAQPRAEAERLLGEHVRATCGHFGHDIESWDVVNEAITPETGELRENVFSGPLGGLGQIELAFRLAREHAPRAQLVYNDFMDWGADKARHRAGVLKLLTELKRRGVPVQALGVQAHIGGGNLPPPSIASTEARDWRRFLDEVAALDLDLLVTEFDVNDQAFTDDIAHRDADVAALARDWLDVTLAQPRLERLVCWGLADHYSWLQEYAPRKDGMPQRPLPFNERLQTKPLYAAIAGALRATSFRRAKRA
jgi:endo-1,4-beta-xylanase